MSEISKEAVEAALNEVRPNLQADGGDVALEEITPDGIVKVKLQGKCGCCPMSQMTLKMAIERTLKAKIPAIKSVESV
ncbi:NifU family protein [Elusimicrobiota bacterium]